MRPRTAHAAAVNMPGAVRPNAPDEPVVLSDAEEPVVVAAEAVPEAEPVEAAATLAVVEG